MNHLIIFDYCNAIIKDIVYSEHSRENVDSLLDEYGFNESTCIYWTYNKPVDIDDSLMIDSEPNSYYGVFFDYNKWKMIFVPLTTKDIEELKSNYYNQKFQQFCHQLGLEPDTTIYMSSSSEIEIYGE